MYEGWRLFSVTSLCSSSKTARELQGAHTKLTDKYDKIARIERPLSNQVTYEVTHLQSEYRERSSIGATLSPSTRIAGKRKTAVPSSPQGIQPCHLHKTAERIKTHTVLP